jgi:hypothetical protein
MPENNPAMANTFALSLLGLTMTSTVPPGRGPSLHGYSGTSCLATISLSLRDRIHSPIEAPRIRLALIG